MFVSPYLVRAIAAGSNDTSIVCEALQIRQTTCQRMPAMRPRRLRFTIRSLMIAIVLMAVLMAVPPTAGIAVVAFCTSCAFFIGAEWLVFRGHRRVAAFAFLFLAVTANLLIVAVCIAPNI
jgi:predicted PurR-regulated permease PerM